MTKPFGTTRINQMGYLLIKIRRGERRWPFLHRIIWESVHGPVPTGFFIHHKNGNKLDNRIENLELYHSHKEHTQRHLQKAIEWGKKLGHMGKGISKSPKHRANISAALKGKMKSPEHRANLSKALLGRHRPDLSARLKGRKLSPEHRAKVAIVYKKLHRNLSTGRFE